MYQMCSGNFKGLPKKGTCNFEESLAIDSRQNKLGINSAYIYLFKVSKETIEKGVKYIQR